MLRKLIVAAALLAAAAPAHAQMTDKLTSGAWTCWMTSLMNEPGMDANLAFNPDRSFDGWFYLEIPDGGDVVGLEFAVAGSWVINGAVITTSVSSSEVLGGTINGEDFSEDELAGMADAMAADLTSFSGQSTIAYIAEHAMVLDEPESSISCWR
jgi:hypothetical protein